MGALLGQSNSNSHNLGAVRLTSILVPSLGIFRGLSRRKKRNRRDKYMAKLYAMGMNRTITMNHSDHWGVAHQLADMADMHGQAVIQAINEVVGHDKLWSPAAKQAEKVAIRAEEIINIKEAEQAKAREDAEKKAREEAERKAKEEESGPRPAPVQTTGGNQPPGGYVPPTVPEIPKEFTTNPYVIGGAALGVGVVALLLLRG